MPNVTAVIPTYNEETTISKKLQNLAKLNYPLNKIDVLIVDDCSTDRTIEVAKSTIDELNLNGKIIKNSQRMGANASYNVAGANSPSDLILRTDADVMITSESLRKAVQVLTNLEDVGAVTGMMDPVYDIDTTATTIEKEYRNLFDQLSISESALHSTYPGGGGFTLIKKSVFSPISVEQGSTDGNISLSIIKNGFRHIYLPERFALELVSMRLSDQVRQKIRRARRVIQSSIIHKDILFNNKYHKFGMQIFPLRFAMFVICPFFIFLGILSGFSFLYLYSPFLAVLSGFGALTLFLLGTRIKFGIINSLTSVFAQQFYLFIGLFLLPKRKSIWKSVRRTK